ncbi:MAG: MATE family efflux transporter, partial [Aminobacterium colombiense]|nr:MATE family efflux transporter [Aminobacterium colombiense]
FWGGDAAIAAMGILLRITQFAVMPVFGLVQGLLPIVGYNYGARLFCRVTTAMKLSIAISSAICTLTGSLLFFAPQLLIPLFTNNREVLPLGISASRYMAIGFPLIGFQVMASGLYQAIGKTVPALFLSLLRQVLILIPLVLFLPYFYGLLGIWTAFPISDILAAIITLVLYRKDIKRLSTLCAEKAQLNKGE